MLLFFLKDSGIHLCVIDDSNEHMLTVWDCQKKSKVAEIKVNNVIHLCSQQIHLRYLNPYELVL